jgi:N-acetylglucosaminyl-diphospho-decaprenol L-rhamnosyltransferase
VSPSGREGDGRGTAVQSPEISIIIVSWNVRDALRACLGSLPASAPEVETLVVDAASTDGTPEMVQAEFPWVKLIASSENLGYSKGNNLGLAEARGDYAFILNPDTELVGDALARLREHMDAHPRVGVIGPQLILPDESVQASRRRFPTFATALFESTWLQPLAPSGMMRAYYAADLPASEAADVDWLVGAALFVRREAWKQVGLFDERFFMYSEEIDWQRRFKAAGWIVRYLPAAQVRHHVGGSSVQVPAATHIRFNTSKVRYFRKYHGAAAGEALRWYLLGHFGVQLLIERLKGLVGHKPELRRARAAVYLEVLRSGLRG